MRTIQVTDIPESDSIPKRNLTNHLMDEDFFHVSRYTTAKLTILQAHKQSSTDYRILANLTIKNITRSIEFSIVVNAVGRDKFSSQASITFNRHLWNISFKGSALENNLVDDDIILKVFVYSK
jgi:polyisoprenoid-binding protein YceI